MRLPKADPKIKVLSLYWNFQVSGVSSYARLLDKVRERAPIDLRHLALVDRRRRVDEATIAALGVQRVEVGDSLDFSWIRRLTNEVAAFEPHLIMTHGFNGYIVAWMLRTLSRRPTPCVASYHGAYHPPTRARRLLAPIFNGTDRLFLKRVALRVASVTECAKVELVRKGIPADKITVIHNGIMADQRCSPETRALVRREWGLPDPAVAIGAVSRLEPIKGVQFLLQAFERIAPAAPQAHLILIGSGPLEDDLQHQARIGGYSDRIIFAGFRADVDRLLEGLDIFVLPSLSEQHSIALLEAMRARKAIVATDVGGTPESIQAGIDGLLVPPADADALACAIRRLVPSAELRAKLGEAAGLRFRARFTVDKMVERTAQWLLEAVEASRANRLSGAPGRANPRSAPDRSSARS